MLPFGHYPVLVIENKIFLLIHMIYGNSHKQIIKYCKMKMKCLLPRFADYYTISLKVFRCCKVHSTFALKFDECLLQ